MRGEWLQGDRIAKCSERTFGVFLHGSGRPSRRAIWDHKVCSLSIFWKNISKMVFHHTYKCKGFIPAFRQIRTRDVPCRQMRGWTVRCMSLVLPLQGHQNSVAHVAPFYLRAGAEYLSAYYFRVFRKEYYVFFSLLMHCRLLCNLF